jgi:hypothetical protein
MMQNGVNEDQRQFVAYVYASLKHLRDVYGLKVNPVTGAAQAALESTFGTSDLADKTNNIFGTTCRTRAAGGDWDGEILSHGDKDEHGNPIQLGFCKFPGGEGFKRFDWSIARYAHVITTRSFYADTAPFSANDQWLNYLEALQLPVDAAGNPTGPIGTEPRYAGHLQYVEAITNMVHRLGLDKLQ